MQEIYLEQTFDAGIDKVFADLEDHEKLGRILGTNIQRIRNGNDGSPNGVGSVRKLNLAPGLSFDETVTAVEPNALIEYVISRGSPLKNHKGRMEFSSANGKTLLRYRIVFESRLPIPGLAAMIRMILGKALQSGLSRYAKKLR